MKKYEQYRKHIEKNVVPQSGELLKEMEELRALCGRLRRSSLELMEFCKDNDLIDVNDESEGYNEWYLVNAEAREALR